MRKFLRSKSGFTLVELLVVVAIIVALAAVIIPNIANMTGRGTDAAKDAELEVVQTALDSAIADSGLGSVYARNNITDLSSSGGAGLDDPATIFLFSTYIREDTPTHGPYCWQTDGLVKQQATC